MTHFQLTVWGILTNFPLLSGYVFEHHPLFRQSRRWSDFMAGALLGPNHKRMPTIEGGDILGDDSGLFKMLFHREDRRLLGVHIIGSGATELVHIGQAVLALGGGIDYFLQTVFNYPTLAECYKTAAFDGVNRLGLAPTDPQLQPTAFPATAART